MVAGLSKAVAKLRKTLTRNDTAFDEPVSNITANRIDASGTYEFNTGRHFLLENGRFIYDLDVLNDPNAFNDVEGKFQITAQPGDEHLFGAREPVRYVPNYELLFGAAAWAENTLESGQHFAIEFGNNDFTNGYRYHFNYDDTAGQVALDIEQVAFGTTVDSVPTDLQERESHGFDHTKPSVARGKINWYGAGLFRAGLSYPVRSTTLPYDVLDDGAYIRGQKNPEIARTANDDDVATGNPNLRIQVRVWADGDAASPITVNACSLGALIRGNATERDREKPAVFYFSDAQQSISQYPTDNVDDALAARVDPTRREVFVKAQPPLFQPGGTGVTMELSVYAVHKDHPDLTVNFNDPDDDGTDEGPSPASQAKEQTDVMQYTRDVTSIPTSTDIRADGTTGLVPNMRHVTTTVGQSSGGNSPGATTGGELGQIKRNIYPEDVVIMLPRSDPNSNKTDGRIKWLKPLWEQDW